MVHLRRDFRAMVDRDAGGRAVGEELPHSAGRLFKGWRKFAAGADPPDDVAARGRVTATGGAIGA